MHKINKRHKYLNYLDNAYIHSPKTIPVSLSYNLYSAVKLNDWYSLIPCNRKRLRVNISFTWGFEKYEWSHNATRQLINIHNSNINKNNKIMFIEHLIYAILYILRIFHTFFHLILINNNNVQTLFLSPSYEWENWLQRCEIICPRSQPARRVGKWVQIPMVRGWEPAKETEVWGPYFPLLFSCLFSYCLRNSRGSEGVQKSTLPLVSFKIKTMRKLVQEMG